MTTLPPGELAAPLTRLLDMGDNHPDPDMVLADVGEQIRRWTASDREQVALACEQIAWFCRRDDEPDGQLSIGDVTP